MSSEDTTTPTTSTTSTVKPIAVKPLKGRPAKGEKAPLTPAQIYINKCKKAVNGEFFKIKVDEAGEFKVSNVVLSGASAQWKKDEKDGTETIYIPNLRLAGSSSDLEPFLLTFFDKKTVRSIITNAYSKDNIPERISVYGVSEKEDGTFLQNKIEDYDAKEFYTTYSKAATLKVSPEDKLKECINLCNNAFLALEATKVAKTHKPDKGESATTSTTTTAVKKAGTVKNAKSRVSELKEDQLLNVTEYTENRTKAHAITIKEGQPSKIKDTAKYFPDNSKVFFYLVKDALPEGAVLFYMELYDVTKAEATEKLSSL